ncbi:MAG: hypothetical protein AB1792_04225 [Candidatus Zixiibacteriota bacterium]
MSSTSWRPVSVGVLVCLFVPAVSAISAVLPRQWNVGPQQQSVLVTSDTVPGSNSIVDLIYAEPDLWAGTARGVSRLTLPGKTWKTYATADGLASAEIPALNAFDNGVWAAASHTEVVEGRTVRFGDGIFRLDAGTDRWVDKSPAGEQASKPFMLAYDLARFRQATLAGCFAGGLVITTDDGNTWRNIFPDAAAQSDFENQSFMDLNNRVFSLAVDTAVAESAAVYVGTAYGIIKYIYLNDTLKVTGSAFADLFLDSTRLYAATERGLSRTPDRGYSWRTFYSSTDGLASDRISTVAAHGDTIWAGVLTPDRSGGAGLAYSYNGGRDWNAIGPSGTIGSNHRPVAIALAAGHVWVAAEEGGLIGLRDPSHLVGEIDPRPAYALLPIVSGDTTRLYVGRDRGIFVHTLIGDSLLTGFDSLYVGTPADGLSQRVVGLSYQVGAACEYPDGIWSLNRSNGIGTGRDGFAVSHDTGTTWRVSSRALPVNDVAFNGCQFYLGTDSGLVFGHIRSLDTVSYVNTYEALINNLRVSRRVRAVTTVMAKNFSGGDSLAVLWVGSDSGLVRSADQGASWTRIFSNPDPYEFDFYQRYVQLGVDTATGNFVQLSGNFVTALAVQPEPGGTQALWAATQGTGQGRYTNIYVSSSERDGISVSRSRGLTWSVPITGHQVWNFAFDGSVVWAASSQGLLHSTNGGITWDTLNNFVDPVSGAVIDTTVEVFGVAVVGDSVWVSTENGMAILDRQGHTRAVRRTFAAVDADVPGGKGGAYATPVPFSPNLTAGGLRVHYRPPVSGPVTITLYDFANRVVRVLAGGLQREAGRQYDETDLWDGRNGDGDIVAVGTYFCVIKYSNGDIHWCKIAVIP